MARVFRGASRGSVLRMILGEAINLLVWGLSLGGLTLFFTARFVVTMLYGVTARDPLTLTAVVATLTVVTIAAAAIPAFRAASINPIDALRSE